MFHIMLGCKVRFRSWVCTLIIRQMNRPSMIVTQGNYHGIPISDLGLCCMDSFKLHNKSSNQMLGYSISIHNRQTFSLRSRPLYDIDLKSYYSSKPTNVVDTKSGNKEGDATKPKKPKKEIKTYITLLGVDNNISVSTVEAAKKLADRRNFKLVKVVGFDPKSSRAVYKFMTESQYLKDDWDDSISKKEKSKDEKLVSLSSSTNENDVLTKFKMMKKWLTKKFEVRVVITGDITSGERVYKIVESELGCDGRIVQKRVKNSSIRFQILPPKKTVEKVADNADKD